MKDDDKNSEIISTKPKRFCFVLMPFDGDFKDIYEIAIKEACHNAGAYCERVDDQNFHEASIFQRIVNQISQADFIIADMSGKNANVFYEVGYAHALDKPTILLTNNAADIPFDLKHFPHLVYERNQISDLREKLTKKVEWFVENPIEKSNESKFEIQLYYASNHFADGPLIMFSKHEKDFEFRGKLTIHNAGSRTLDMYSYTFNVLTKYQSLIYTHPPSTKSGALVDIRNEIQDRERLVEVLLPDDTFQYTLRALPTLLPNAYETIEIDIDTRGRGIMTDKVEYIFRIITENGSRDFPLIIDLP